MLRRRAVAGGLAVFGSIAIGLADQGLLYAVAAQDQPSFHLILSWTARILRRRHDSLHAWRYIPNQQPSIPDLNNTVDGDMFIATALIRAGRTVHSLAAWRSGIRDDGRNYRQPVLLTFPMMTEPARIVRSQQWNRLQSALGYQTNPAPESPPNTPNAQVTTATPTTTHK